MEIDLILLLNLPHIEVTDFSMTDKESHIHCKSLVDDIYCPLCLSKTSSVTMYQERCIHDMPLLGRTVYLHLEARQFHCQDCHRYFNERFDFVKPSKNLTTRDETYLYKMSEHICISDVSVKEDIAWATINEIHQRYGQKILSTRDVWQQVRHLGIDEISVLKGMKNYACCLVDLERGIVLDFLENRHKDTLIAYFKAKGSDFCNQIEVVSFDMWRGRPCGCLFHSCRGFVSQCNICD